MPVSPVIRVENARRHTGAGYFLPGPGAVVELWGSVDAEAWGRTLDTLLPALGLPLARRSFPFARGLVTAVPAPIDQLLPLADALEEAALRFAGLETCSFEETVARFTAAPRNPALTALHNGACRRGVAVLWDEDQLSLGMGQSAETFPLDTLPEPDWRRYARIPVALVTGTNGKTTTTRMAGAMLRQAGFCVGLSSTEGITVDGVVVEEGDWTGPGAARRILRDPSVTAALLETARGGILRRGLAYSDADAALVTNVADDHLGDYGIDTVAEMTRVKAVVWEAVRDGGRRIANAGCSASMAWIEAHRPDVRDWIFFAVDPAHLPATSETWTVRDGWIVHHRRVVALAEVPCTFGGTAAHNVENALAASALASALGVSDTDIAAALRAFGRDDNPGRLELHERDGVRIVVDFAHNAHAVHALAPVIAHLRGTGRLFVAPAQPGDRTEEELVALVDAVAALKPDAALLRPLRGYERGQSVEAGLAALAGQLARHGVRSEVVEDEVAVLTRAGARAGDLILLLAHIDHEPVRAWLSAAPG